MSEYFVLEKRFHEFLEKNEQHMELINTLLDRLQSFDDNLFHLNLSKELGFSNQRIGKILRSFEGMGLTEVNPIVGRYNAKVYRLSIVGEQVVNQYFNNSLVFFEGSEQDSSNESS